MAEKMAERIAEILKEPNFQTAEKALTDFCGPMDGEFRNLLVDIIVERWIDTPKDVPFSYARSIWNRKDINKEVQLKKNYHFGIWTFQKIKK